MAEQKKPPKKDGSIAKKLFSYYLTKGNKNQAPKRKFSEHERDGGKPLHRLRRSPQHATGMLRPKGEGKN